VCVCGWMGREEESWCSVSTGDCFCATIMPAFAVVPAVRPAVGTEADRTPTPTNQPKDQYGAVVYRLRTSTQMRIQKQQRIPY